MAAPRITIEPREGGVVVAVHGELDVTSSQLLDDGLTEGGPGSGRMILDLSGVDFMDTTALAVIISHWRRHVEADGMFLIAGARYRYTKALWITGLADRLPMYDSVDEALSALQNSGGATAAS